jgi:hypothetical protein
VLVIGVAIVAVAALATPGAAAPPAGAPNCTLFPANSVMHADVRSAPVHAKSAAWISRIGPTYGLKADFGAGLWDGGPIGIPYTTVPATQSRVPVTFDWPDESDSGPYPIPPNAPIEGGSSSTGDRHVLVVDRDRCELWETFSSYPQNGGASWTAGSGVHFNLTSNAMRTSGWTSADAAGLPMLPFLVRYDEIVAGVIDHPLRITVPRTASAFVWPASHRAGTGTVDDPPMGTWFRLRADFDISGFSATNQIILRALKEHGAVLADNGSRWYMSGVPDERWNNDDLHKLGQVPGKQLPVRLVLDDDHHVDQHDFDDHDVDDRAAASVWSQRHLRGRRVGMDREHAHEARPRVARAHRAVDRPHDLYELG